jgi:sulfofructose kinase
MLSPGGQVATAVVACSRLGLRTKYVGTVGDDVRGEIQRESLEGTGVDISGLLMRVGCPNQTAYIVIDQSTGERTVLWQRADCLRLHASEIDPEAIANTRLLHIDGYDTEAAAFAGACARRHSVPVSLDVDTVYPEFEPVLQHVDYLVAGSGWPTKWTGEADPFSALTKLRNEYRFRVAAMTLGDRGALALYDGGWAYSPAFEVTCVDTTGAGDVFHGAFCYAMLAGLEMENALDFSNAAAALNCTGIGARGHIPTLLEVHSLMAAASGNPKKRRLAREIVERLSRKASATASPAAL